jgi:ribosomal protein L11 methyltransferase
MKTHKPLWWISVATSIEAEDAVSELLEQLSGNTTSSYFDTETGASRINLFSEQKFPPEFRRRVADGLKNIQSCGLDVGAGKIQIARLKREDWAASWKRHFRPIEIGSQLLIKSSWSRRKARKNQAVVVLDPGLSFGTGQHPTTSFCLHEIARRRKIGGQQSFLDIGTGSGILSIAAAKLGCKPIFALDFDPEAVRVARDNARINKVLHRLQIAEGDVAKLPLRPKQKFDLVCANLISNLLIEQRKRIVKQLSPCGTLVLAGILQSEFRLVQSAFEELRLKQVAGKSEKEWRSGSFCFA